MDNTSKPRRRILQKCPKIPEIARRENESRCGLQMDKEVCRINEIVFRKIAPNVSDAWRADELYLKVRGNPKYLYALIG
jgi:hypothetical protein